MITEPSENLSGRNRARSCPGLRPVARSAMMRPIAGPMAETVTTEPGRDQKARYRQFSEDRDRVGGDVDHAGPGLCKTRLRECRRALRQTFLDPSHDKRRWRRIEHTLPLVGRFLLPRPSPGETPASRKSARCGGFQPDIARGFLQQGKEPHGMTKGRRPDKVLRHIARGDRVAPVGTPACRQARDGYVERQHVGCGMGSRGRGTHGELGEIDAAVRGETR